MKKAFMISIFLVCIIFSTTVFASISAPSVSSGASAPIIPKEYSITINHLNSKEDIKSVEILYSTRLSFSYSTNERERLWLNVTDFGYKYKNYTDAEIIPTLSPEEIDAIANVKIGR